MQTRCPCCDNLIKLTISKLQKKKDSVLNNAEIDNLQNINNDILLELKLGKFNSGNGALTKKIRYKKINYEFKYRDPLNTYLQCTEYVQYRVKQVLNIDINWPIKTGRHGGKWADIFEKYGYYKVLNMPKKFCAVSLKKRHGSYGHIAFVEKVLPDNKIHISEVNLDLKGSYSEKRILSKFKWQNEYEGRFIDFT